MPIDWKVVQGRLGARADGVVGRETWGLLLARTVGREVGPTIERMSQSFAKYAERFEITTARRVADFVSNAAHECQGFKVFEENLNYSAQGLANTWPGRYAIDPHAKVKVPNPRAFAIQRRPEAIANDTYALRMGNRDAAHDSDPHPDGWQYRGRGIFMLTGFDNYKRYGEALGLDLVGFPELASDPGVSVLIAMQYVKFRNLNSYSDADKPEDYRRGVNGGTIGLADVLTTRRILLETLQ